jgi:hypothetical protein
MNQVLLQQTFRQLSKRLKLTAPVRRAIKKVESELREKGIHLKIKYWISNEWFTPDSTVGVAIPFYILDRKLTMLEKNMVGVAEGATFAEAVRILRHEIAHVLDNAFQLRRLRMRHRIFGKASRPYPTQYTYAPTDVRFVRHLQGGYAQAHPCEDFAETFAVWLNPRSGWRKRYAETPAIRKLEYVDQLMKRLIGRRPVRKGGPKIDSLSTLKGTLQDHYKNKTRKLRRTAVRDQALSKLKDLNEIKNQIAEENRKSIRYNPFEKDRLISELSHMTGRHPELLQQYVEKVQKQAKRQGVNLNRLIQIAYPKTKGILVQEAKSYFRQGRHQILL